MVKKLPLSGELPSECEADITSKNQVRKQRFLDNFIAW